MTMKAKSDIETIRDAVENMAPNERAQLLAFVEGMAFHKEVQGGTGKKGDPE